MSLEVILRCPVMVCSQDFPVYRHVMYRTTLPQCSKEYYPCALEYQLFLYEYLGWAIYSLRRWP